jgi:hypothetical protein
MHYVCARKNRAQADEFFEKVCAGVRLDRAEAAYKLHKRLADNARGNERIKPLAIAALTVKAWNAMRSGAPLGVLKWRGEQNPQEPFPKAQ